MNFGAFAGGMAVGMERGVKLGKHMADVIKEAKLQDLRDKGMAEAEAQRAQSVQDLIKEQGVAAEAAPKAPIETAIPTVETPQQAAAVSAASPTANPDAAGANTAAAAMQPVAPATVSAASPTANPDEAAANTAVAAQPSAAPSVSTQTPASTAASGLPGAGKMTHDGLPARANADGSYSTEVSITVTDPRLNGGKPTNIPSLWGGKEVDEDTAVKNAIASGKTYQSFGSVDQAVGAAKSRSEAGGAGAPAPVTEKANGKFSVNGKSYATREAALSAAEKEAPSAADLFMKNAVPKIEAQYLQMGDPDKALAWSKYADSHNGKRAMKDWAAAFTAPDFDTAATKFGKYYTDHINDGVDYTGHKMLTKSDGSKVAVVTLKDKATGKESQMELTRQSMLALGGANNPQKLFETEQAKQAQADKFKYEQSIKAQERRNDTQDKKDLEGYKQDRLDQREGKKFDAGVDAKVAALRDAGYSDDDIKKMMPAIVGAGEHKKTTDPTERRALVASDLLKNDATFARLPKDKQNQKIDDTMSVIYGDGPKPAAPVKSPATNPNTIYKNNETGERFRIIDGKPVPIAAAAGGLPK